MLRLKDLMDAVETTVKTRYPGEPVFVDYLPKDFKRPSFALECQKNETTDVNPVLVQRSVTVLLTCFVEMNAYYDSSREELNRRLDRICTQFAQGFLSVGERKIKVQANRGKGAPDFAEASLVFTWTDQRRDEYDPNDPAGPIPRMEDFAVNGTVIVGGEAEESTR